MTIHVFGDSFAARYSDEDKPYYFLNETGDLWYDILKNKSGEDVIISANGGEGPYQTFERFYKSFENGGIKNNDKIVFFLSCPYRFPFSFLDVNEQPVCLAILQNILNQNEKVSSYAYEIFLVKNTFDEEIYRFNIKNLYFLKTLSQLKNIKIISFSCFHNTRLGVHDYVDLKNKYEVNKLNDELFRYYPKPLYHVTIEESEDKLDYDDEKNSRPNHLSFCNHEILSNIIFNFFYNTDYDEEFKKSFLKGKWGNLKGRKHFIYD